MDQGLEVVAGDHFQLFESWYTKLDPKNTGSIQAGPAAQFLKKSGLNDNLLSRIWDLSDPGGKGYFDKAGLFVALKLVALVQNGGEPNLAAVNTFTPPPNMGGGAPPHPPPPLAKSPGPPLVPAPPAPTAAAASSGVWTITPADRGRYDQIFNSLGPEANKIHGNKVRGVMINSKLPTDILGKIWDLADMDKDGSLDRVEFSIAMHLIYKVLENNTLPVSIPQEMLSSARRAGVAGQGPVPAPLAPPSQVLVPDNKVQQPSGPPPAPWVVTAADEARYDVMFHNADLDKDGFVSGNEIKGVFLQSGLPQMVLAHIWNVCDMKQTGKLSSEQFALAMWLIQQKIAGTDPPSTLTPEMIPPTMRPKSSVTEAPAVAKPTYNNSELQAVADEIEEVAKDKLKLEAEIQQKESSIRLKNNEIKNLQSELDTLLATLKQLENQKGAAQKRLDDLGQQKGNLDRQLRDLRDQCVAEIEEVEALRLQVEEQESSLKCQEEEVMSKQKELNDLRSREMELEASVLSMKKVMDQLGNSQQETLLYIAQVKTKIEELQDQEHHMTQVITVYDSAIAAGDASTLSESSLVEVHPHFEDYAYMSVGPQSPSKDPLSPVMSPVYNPVAETNGISSDDANESTAKAKDTSFVGGHDPFANAFGGAAQSTGDPFTVWDSSKSNAAPPPPPAPQSDPFGGDAFVASKPVVPPAPTAASRSKPPPRPAPPKTRPAKPPPPQFNSNNNPLASTGDPFGGAAKSERGGFADFANFADFETKYSSANSSSSLNKSAWGGDVGANGTPTPPPPLPPPQSSSSAAATSSSSSSSRRKGPSLNPAPPPPPIPQHSNTNSPFRGSESGFGDPFEDFFGTKKHQAAANTAGGDPFGAHNGGEPHLEGPNPFGGDYDPFKDSQGIKEADEFSWDDEADFFEGLPDPDPSSGFGSGPAAGVGKDPFSLTSNFSPPTKGRNLLNNRVGSSTTTTITTPTTPPTSSRVGSSVSTSGANARSKSALGDPLFLLNQVRKGVPTRPKTSLGAPGNLDLDFDPLSNSKMEFSPSKSNEDLLNEHFVPSAARHFPSSTLSPPNNIINNNNNRYNKNNNNFGDIMNSAWPSSETTGLNNNFNDPFGGSGGDSGFGGKSLWPPSGGGGGDHPSKSMPSEEPISRREQADIDLALALSNSMTSSVTSDVPQSHRSARSPSTGL